MLKASEIIEKYIKFFEEKGHKRIINSPLVPQNDPTTLFTSSGMQPLVQYFLGEEHPAGKRLVNVQNCFRAADIDEVGDNRHTTFFRMLGNWSLGDYFKKEEIPWFWEFLTKEIGLPKKKLYITVFKGDGGVGFDSESEEIWKEVLTKSFGTAQDHRIFKGDVSMNWWSRIGLPQDMPKGEPGGPDSEVFFDFGTAHNKKFGEKCHPNCQCGRFLEIGNSVFMEYQKGEDGFKPLPNKNVDFGGGLERLLAAVENQSDIFQTSLFSPIIKTIEDVTQTSYDRHENSMRIVTDHFVAAAFIISAGIKSSKTEQGYILRRLIRRGLDSFRLVHGTDISSVLEKIVEQYKDTDPDLTQKFEEIKNTILEEEQNYEKTLGEAKKIIAQKSPSPSPSPSPSEEESDELMGVIAISADDAFKMYTTHGLSPTQIKSLGYVFDQQEFAKKMEEHQDISRKGAGKKFQGGLADHSGKTIMGHTATHLLHQALRDVLGNKVFQAGSNITTERIRFDFSYDKKLTDEEIAKVQNLVNEKIEENLPVHFEIMSLDKAKEAGAIGLFDEKYEDKVKVYFINDYSVEFCGGPHVDFTGRLKRFKIIKQENIGHGQKRIYAKVGAL